MSSELHVFGQITGFEQIGQSNHYSSDHLFLNYHLIHGDNWQLISGKQYSVTSSSDGIWSEPLDWHFTLSSIQNWPRLKFLVYKENLSLLSNISDFKLNTLEGHSTPYAQGICYIPTELGHQTLFVKLTSPRSLNWTSTKNLISEYTGLTTRKNNFELEQYFEELEDNPEIELEPKLTIKLELYVINRFFRKFGVECK